jgi:DnaJ-class molecular chaperone
MNLDLCPTCNGSGFDERSVGEAVINPCYDCYGAGTRKAYEDHQDWLASEP